MCWSSECTHTTKCDHVTSFLAADTCKNICGSYASPNHGETLRAQVHLDLHSFLDSGEDHGDPLDELLTEANCLQLAEAALQNETYRDTIPKDAMSTDSSLVLAPGTSNRTRSRMVPVARNSSTDYSEFCPISSRN